MTNKKFIAPALDKNSFTCPHCDVLAQHTKVDLYLGGTKSNTAYTTCCSCNQKIVWHNIPKYDNVNGYVNDYKILYPSTHSIPMPNEDLPEDIKQDYMEAREICNLSPRSACALLRLALQKLCKHLGESGSINDMIGSLVKKGLPLLVQQALDVIRVVGNNAVHPGEIDLTDDVETATQIFSWINFITEKLISNPKQLNALYASLPQKSQDAIAKRDKVAP